ncbi:MAG: Holliday junction branch migration protein RuvA [Pseudomonadales bacterium]
MIARLSGRIAEISANVLVLDVAGVGYEIEFTARALGGLGAPGSDCICYTHQVVREDGQSLFGFATREERDVFRILIRVNGVGPKLALAVLSGMTVAELVRAVGDDDAQALTRISGVGKKTAERLLVEIRDRLTAFVPAPARVASGEPAQATKDPQREAVSGLIGLGYRPQEATRVVGLVYEEGLAAEDVIRRALRSMVPSNA